MRLETPASVQSSSRPPKPGARARALGVLLALACLGASATALATTSVRPFGSFLAVELPGDVEHQSGVRETVVGDIEHFTALAKSGGASLSITATRLPGFVVAVTTDEMLYRKARNELLKNYAAHRTSWTRCTHAGCPCRKLLYQAKDGRKGMARLYLRDHVLVVINAVFDGDEAIARRFLASARP